MILGTLITLLLGCVKIDDRSKKQRLIVVLISIFNTTAATLLRKMSLPLDNNLPSKVIQFGSSDDNEIAFSCHLDSCTATNTGNSLLHTWIMTTYPDIVASYEAYGDIDVFQPVTLDSAAYFSAAENM